MPAEDILRLPLGERLKLVEAIWESIREHPEDLPLTDTQRKELERRLEADELDPGAAERAEEVLSRIRRRT